MITMTRADRAYCRKWAAAHRKGKPTAEITAEYLGRLKGPGRPNASAVSFGSMGVTCASPVTFLTPLSESAKSRIGLSTDDEAFEFQQYNSDWRDDL